jgi:hypothetical protein
MQFVLADVRAVNLVDPFYYIRERREVMFLRLYSTWCIYPVKFLDPFYYIRERREVMFLSMDSTWCIYPVK